MTIDELNAFMEKHGFCNVCNTEPIKKEYVADLVEDALTDGYGKAIDDFADKLSKYLGVGNATKYGNKNAEQQRNSYDTLMKYEIADAIDDVAEQLKVGGNYEKRKSSFQI